MENLDVLVKNGYAEKMEKLPFSLAKKMPLILYLLAQAQGSLTSNGVSSLVIGDKRKIFPDRPLIVHVHAHVCMIYFIFLITEEGYIDSKSG